MKPSHQWETRLHVARREEQPDGAGRGPMADDRAESYVLEFRDGPAGSAHLSLAQQQIDARAAADPDTEGAIAAWLIARGARHINLFLRGDDASLKPLRQASIAPSEFGSYSGNPTRLITLCPSNAELVHALGCFDRVVACEDSSDYPAATRDCIRLGPDLGPDLDRVAELKPDLVVSSLSVPGMERVVSGLRARGVAQVVLAPRSIADVLHECTLLADALGVPERGERVVAQMEAERQALLDAQPGPPARVYLEWWPKPMFTPAADCYSNELISLAGGQNVFAKRQGSSVQVHPAELLEADPDVCFVSWCGVPAEKLDPDNLRSREGLAGLRAGAAGDIYPLDECFSGRPGPRMLEAARVMAAGIRAARANRAAHADSEPSESSS